MQNFIKMIFEPSTIKKSEARVVALDMAVRLGICVNDSPYDRKNEFLWNGKTLRTGSLDAYNICHEIAHWLIAKPKERLLVNYGLGADAHYGPSSIASVSKKRIESAETLACLGGCLLVSAIGLRSIEFLEFLGGVCFEQNSTRSLESLSNDQREDLCKTVSDLLNHSQFKNALLKLLKKNK
jgi:hypothetical protein